MPKTKFKIKSKSNPEIELVESSKPRLYCGKSDTLPDGYDDFGEPFECLRKGFGAGKASVINNNKKILTSNDILDIANTLAIPIDTKHGKKSTETLIHNIIRVLENL
jgi:hypothetical protein